MDVAKCDKRQATERATLGFDNVSLLERSSVKQILATLDEPFYVFRSLRAISSLASDCFRPKCMLYYVR